LNKRKIQILFITWDGPQVTYLESLFLPIFNKLADRGFQFHVLQFTWADPLRVKGIRLVAHDFGCSYQAQTIWRRPIVLGSLLTTLYSVNLIRKAIHDYQIDVVMPRSIYPALSTLLALQRRSLPIIFDADGLPLDEKIDFTGQSPRSFMHRFLRDVEVQAASRANIVLTRSAKACDILHSRAGAGTNSQKFYVVGNGRDDEMFCPADATQRARIRSLLGVGADIPLIIYCGSMGAQYCVDEMLEFFSIVHARRSDAHLLFLTGSPETLLNTLNNYHHLSDSVTVLTVAGQMVSQYLGSADLGLALRQPSFSMQAVAPIKLGEYLLCGLPVLSTDRIGDSVAVTADVGLLLHSMGIEDLTSAANWFLDSVLAHRARYRLNCRAVGMNMFCCRQRLSLIRERLKICEMNYSTKAVKIFANEKYHGGRLVKCLALLLP
jgi:glycosyltransferase involved in cell wall biosynthesis